MSSTSITIESDLSSLKLNRNIKDGTLYIVLKHTGPSLSASSIVTVTFTITGVNAAQYNSIPSITLTLVDPAAY